VFYATLYGLTTAEAGSQAERYLRLMGLWERRTEPVATFSRGMKQKMAIARAALHEPRLLFLDEPTTGLDPDAAKTVREFIVQLRGEGRTVFLCTHNLDEADRLCDRIAFFRRNVIRIAHPAELREALSNKLLVGMTLLPPVVILATGVLAVAAAAINPPSEHDVQALYAAAPAAAGLDPKEAVQGFIATYFLILFMLIPTVVPLTMAIYSVIGEKS